jgi:hypothetical protein
MSEQAAIDEVEVDSSPIERLAERRARLYGALAKAQGEFPTIPRDRTVRVQMKTGGSYTFAYAPLDTILRVLRPALAGNGLGITQTFDGDRLVTLLVHEGGGTIESALALPRQGANWQEYGSAVTYARRYAITALLGIASEEDDDGNAASGNVAQPQERVKREAEKPAEGAGKTSAKPRMAQKPQITKVGVLRARLEKAGLLSEEIYRKVLKNEYQVEHTPELTSEAISHLISRLESYAESIPKAEATEKTEPSEQQPLAS